MMDNRARYYKRISGSIYYSTCFGAYMPNKNHITAKCDIANPISIIIDQIETDEERMLYRDSFAVACYLHMKGQKRAGIKLFRTVLDGLGWNGRISYFNELINNLDGNEPDYARSVGPHSEIYNLFTFEYDGSSSIGREPSPLAPTA